nr:transposase [Streptosporangium canum]
MSLRPRPAGEVPESTVRVARAAFPKGCLAIRIRDELGPLFEDEQFAEAFPARGGPGLSPGILALVSVLQFAEGLSDRQAADAVHGRIDWKYGLALELTDAGFDFSVLSEFRDRLIACGIEQRVLDTLLERCSHLHRDQPHPPGRLVDRHPTRPYLYLAPDPTCLRSRPGRLMPIGQQSPSGPGGIASRSWGCERPVVSPGVLRFSMHP